MTELLCNTKIGDISLFVLIGLCEIFAKIEICLGRVF